VPAKSVWRGAGLSPRPVPASGVARASRAGRRPTPLCFGRRDTGSLGLRRCSAELARQAARMAGAAASAPPENATMPGCSGFRRKQLACCTRRSQPTLSSSPLVMVEGSSVAGLRRLIEHCAGERNQSLCRVGIAGSVCVLGKRDQPVRQHQWADRTAQGANRRSNGIHLRFSPW
jgi:hypothetical protein